MKLKTLSTTFGAGREAFNNVVSVNKFNHIPHCAKLPGPGSYNPKAKNTNRKIGLRPKTAVDSKFIRSLSDFLFCIVH